MVKTAIYSFLLGVVITGACWFFVGRSELSDIRESVKRVDVDLERTEQLVSEFQHDLGRYSEGISNNTGTSVELRGGLSDLRGRFTEFPGEVRAIRNGVDGVSNGITDVEGSVLKIVRLSGEFADILYEYRRLGEQSRPEE